MQAGSIHLSWLALSITCTCVGCWCYRTASCSACRSWGRSSSSCLWRCWWPSCSSSCSCCPAPSPPRWTTEPTISPNKVAWLTPPNKNPNNNSNKPRTTPLRFFGSKQFLSGYDVPGLLELLMDLSSYFSRLLVTFQKNCKNSFTSTDQWEKRSSGQVVEYLLGIQISQVRFSITATAFLPISNSVCS